LVAEIRLATVADAAQIQAIYEPIVLETAISFELVPPTVEEFQGRITRTLEKTPWLVCEIDGQVAGYSYAGQYRAREAYQWSAEVTVYVNPQFYQRGVGRAMYISLFEILRLQGFRMAFAAIVLPNDPSIALHKSVGFSAIGEFKSVGYKLGEWQDMGWWQLDLLPTELKPASHTSLPEVENSGQFRRAIKAGLAELH